MITNLDSKIEAEKISKSKRSNTMSGLEVVVINGNITGAIAKFKQKILKSGLINELRDREHYTKPSVAKRNKSNKARAVQKKLEAKKNAALKDK